MKICRKCNFQNSPQAMTCGNCGDQLPYGDGGPGMKAGNKGNLKIILIVLGALLGACLLCGIFGGIMNKINPPKEAAQDQPGNSNPNSSKAQGGETTKASNAVNSNEGNSNTSNSKVIEPADKNPDEIVNIPALAKKSPAEIDKVLGKPAYVTPITSTPEEMPGEFRNYEIAGLEDTFQVRIYKGKAVAFVLSLPKAKQVSKPQELAKLGGFNPADGGETPTPFVTTWKGDFGGVNFKEVSALKSKVDNYDTLRVKVAQ